MATHPALADLGIAPRLLTREQAAAYCGLSVHGFSEWVKTGRLPGPIAGTARWDLRAIDAALDSLSGIGIGSLALDQWKAKHARSS
jgi:predicted DNA-binding transcriptional regulator AlpA